MNYAKLEKDRLVTLNFMGIPTYKIGPLASEIYKLCENQNKNLEKSLGLEPRPACPFQTDF